jgi:hypothetical protein
MTVLIAVGAGEDENADADFAHCVFTSAHLIPAIMILPFVRGGKVG